jgi:hypothetical protein
MTFSPNILCDLMGTCGKEVRSGSQQLSAVTPASFCCVVRAVYKDKAPPWKESRVTGTHILPTAHERFHFMNDAYTKTNWVANAESIQTEWKHILIKDMVLSPKGNIPST